MKESSIRPNILALAAGIIILPRRSRYMPPGFAHSPTFILQAAVTQAIAVSRVQSDGDRQVG